MSRTAKSSDVDTDAKAGYKTRGIGKTETTVDSPLRRSSRVKTAGKQNESSPDSPLSDNSNTQPVRNTRRRTDVQNNSTMSEKSRSLRLRRSSVVSDTIETTDKHVATPTRKNRNSSTSDGVNKFDEQTSKRLTRAGSETKSPQIITRPLRRTRASSMGPEGVAENIVSVLMNHTPVNTRKRNSMASLGATVIEENEEKMIPFVTLDRVLPNLKEINETCTENSTTEKLNKSISKETLNSSSGNTSKEEMDVNDGNARKEHATAAEHPSSETTVQETEGTSIIKNTLSDISENIRSESTLTTTQIKTPVADVQKAQSPIISSEVAPRKLRLRIESTIKEEEEHLSDKENRVSNIIEDPKNNDLAVPNILSTSNKSIKENDEDTDNSDNMLRLTATDTESLSEATLNDSTGRNALCIEICEDSSLDENIQIVKCPENVNNDSLSLQEDLNQDGGIRDQKSKENDKHTDKSLKFDDTKKEEIQHGTSDNKTTAGDGNSELRLILEVEETAEEDEEVCLTQAETVDDEFERNDQFKVSDMSEGCSKLSDMIADLDRISTSSITETSANETSTKNLQETEMATNETTMKDLQETEMATNETTTKDLQETEMATNETTTKDLQETEMATNETTTKDLQETEMATNETTTKDLQETEMATNETTMKDLRETEVAEKVSSHITKEPTDIRTESDNFELGNTNNTLSSVEPIDEVSKKVDVNQAISEVDDCSPSEEKSTNDMERNKIAVRKQKEEMQVDISQDTSKVDDCSPLENKSTNDIERNEISVQKQKEEMPVDVSQDTSKVDDRSPLENKSTNDIERNEISVQKQKEEMPVNLLNAHTSAVDNRSPSKEKSTNTERNEIAVPKQQEEEFDLCDVQVDLFQDIPAEKWKEERISDKNSVHSMSTERLENESENECEDFVLVDKEASRSVENIGREKESSDYDSDDTVLLKARKNLSKEKTVEQMDQCERNKSPMVKDTQQSVQQKEIENEEEHVENQMEEVQNAENVSARTSIINESSKQSPTDTCIEKSANANSTDEIGQSLDTESPLNMSKRKFVVHESVEKSDSEEDSVGEKYLLSESSVGSPLNASDSSGTDRTIDSDIEREYNLCGADVCKFSDDDVPGDECRASETESSDPDDDGSDLADFVVDDEISEELSELESSDADKHLKKRKQRRISDEEESESKNDKHLESDATEDESNERKTKKRKQRRISEKEESELKNDKHLESDATEDESNERKTKKRKQRRISEKEESESKNDEHLESEAMQDERKTKKRKQRRISEKEGSELKNDEHLESEATQDERRTKNKKQRRISDEKESESKNDKHLESDATEDKRRTKDKKQRRISDEKESKSKNDEHLESDATEDESNERKTKKRKQRRISEKEESELKNDKHLESDATEDKRRTKDKKQKRSTDETTILIDKKIKRSVEEVDDEEKELEYGLQTLLEEETPKRVTEKGQWKSFAEGNVENKCTDISKKEKCKLRKATKIKKSVEEVDDEEKELEYGLRMLLEEETPERVTEKGKLKKATKIKKSVEEVDDEEKELEYGLRTLLEEETPERVTEKGQRKRFAEGNVENNCTDIPKKKKGKLRKATKIKRSVVEVGDEVKELADGLKMAVDEETPKKVKRKRVVEETVEVIKTKYTDITKKKKSKLRKSKKLDLPLSESVERKSEIETGNKMKRMKTEDNKMLEGKTTVKRLAEEVVESLSDFPAKALKRRKLSEIKELPSRSIPRSELGKRNINVERDLIELSAYGSTSNFYVANLQKVVRSAKTSKAKTFRQRMLNRNPRQPISYYTMFLEKQAASSKH